MTVLPFFVREMHTQAPAIPMREGAAIPLSEGMGLTFPAPPVPKIELTDLMCSAFPAKKKNDSFPLVTGIPGQIQLFSLSQPFSESLP